MNNLKGVNLVHGHRLNNKQTSSEYHSWKMMKQRCLNKNKENYKNYGGRGIKICPRWIDSFVNFLNDMGYKPSKKYSIDRINNNGNYEPSNCRWATQKQQTNNCRSNVVKGEN